MKNYLPKMLTIGLVLFVTSCQVDEELVKAESAIQTVKIDEAKSFLTQSRLKSNTKGLKVTTNYEFDKITQEELTNTDQLLTVIPVSKTDSRRFDRILLLKINNEIKSVVFKMYSDEPKIAPNFSGKILIYDLDGNFINGFGVKKGVFTFQYVKSSNTSKKSSSKVADDWDLGVLSEVIITGRSRSRFRSEIADFGWGDNLSGGDSGSYDYSWMYDSGGNGSSSGNNGDENLIMPPPPELPISDIIKFLSCLKTNANANLTVFAQKMNNGNGVGHAFISISQGNNTMVYGYYPRLGGVKVLTGPGIMGENGGHNYDVSATMGISGDQLQQIINLSQNYQNADYDLSFNNCSDFATEILNITGVSTSGWIDTPNTVANILSTLDNHASGSNYAPKTKRSCP